MIQEDMNKHKIDVNISANGERWKKKDMLLFTQGDSFLRYSAWKSMNEAGNGPPTNPALAISVHLSSYIHTYILRTYNRFTFHWF